MPFVPIPDTARVVMTFNKDTREQVHVFHATRTGGWNLSALQALAAEFADWWNDQYRVTVSNQVALTEVTATDISVPNGQQHTLPIVPPNPGTLVGPPAPQNATQTISWRTGFSGRRNRGRTYTVGLIETDASDQDTIVGARITALSVAAASIIARLINAGMELVVASYTFIATRPIFTAIVENIVDSMRRRLPGRGR